MYGKMQESGLTEIIPHDMYLSYLGPLSCIFTSWVSSGLTSSPLAVAAIADDCDILCLLIWQSVFHLSATLLSKHQLIYLFEDHKYQYSESLLKQTDYCQSIHNTPLTCVTQIYSPNLVQNNILKIKLWREEKLFLHVLQHTCVLVCPNFFSLYRTWFI